MLDELGAIIERLNTKTLTDSDIDLLCQILKRNVTQDVSQSGKFNLAVGEGRVIHVGDHYSGATPEQIRIVIRELVQELRALQPTYPHSPHQSIETSGRITDDPPFRKLVLDPTTLEAINVRLEIIEEIYNAGYLSEVHQQDLTQLKHHIQSFSNLNQEFQSIAEQGDRLIQEAITAMQLQLDALKLSGKTLAEEAQLELSPAELECQRVETAIFQTFVNRLEDSRLGADWIGKNIELLIRCASNEIVRRFPDLNASDQAVNDFKFSLKQFLEQVNLCLYWGSYDILDSPEIPLVFNIECYETAFRAMKELIPERLNQEAIKEIEACLDYLIGRLSTYL